MNNPNFSRSTFPNGGWQFRQPQTGWRAPTPTSSTFDQTVNLIYQHRRGNPAAVQKHKLSLDLNAIATELETFTRMRLGITEITPPKIQPRQPSQGFAGAAVAAAGSVVAGIKRAAQGSAVVMDWLTSGGRPVERSISESRALVCSNCPKNVPGAWYTVAPAELIRATLDQRKDVDLSTPLDEALFSCDVCKCLNRLKIWCPKSHIVSHTKPEIMAEFPPHCWIVNGSP